MNDFPEEILLLRQRLSDAEKYLKIDELKDQKLSLEKESANPELWNDQDKGRQVQTDLSRVVEDLERYSTLKTRIEDAETLIEMAAEEKDQSLDDEIGRLISETLVNFDSLEVESLLSGEYDAEDAVCQIQAGAGGTDAQDWAEMLLRMYTRWAENKGLKIELDSVSPGTEAGISSAEFIVRGRHSFGFLQSERGVHRLVRISPFNKESKRHTAFASFQVVPFFEKVTDQIDIDETELRIDTYRSSGAGGQHVNVTDSAVRITHTPTGIVTSCQNERSQHQNRDRAMQMLAAKLLDLERQRRDEQIAEISGKQSNVGFGSQIRSYVLQPYQMVKDLRTDFEIGDVARVLDGGLDDFIEAYLRWNRAK